MDYDGLLWIIMDYYGLSFIFVQNRAEFVRGIYHLGIIIMKPI
jgi:hypothetical protein